MIPVGVMMPGTPGRGRGFRVLPRENPRASVGGAGTVQVTEFRPSGPYGDRSGVITSRAPGGFATAAWFTRGMNVFYGDSRWSRDPLEAEAVHAGMVEAELARGKQLDVRLDPRTGDPVAGNPGRACGRCGSPRVFLAGEPYLVGVGRGRSALVQVYECEDCGLAEHEDVSQGSTERLLAEKRAGVMPGIRSVRSNPLLAVVGNPYMSFGGYGPHPGEIPHGPPRFKHDSPHPGDCRGCGRYVGVRNLSTGGESGGLCPDCLDEYLSLHDPDYLGNPGGPGKHYYIRGLGWYHGDCYFEASKPTGSPAKGRAIEKIREAKTLPKGERCVACGKWKAPGGGQNRVAGAGAKGRVKSASRKTAAKVKKNRVAKRGQKKQPLEHKRYSLAEGQRRFEGYDDAFSVYREFHDRNPQRVDLYALDDGKDEVRVEPVHVALHRTLETNYVVPWDSNKKGTLWLHEHKEGAGLRGLQKGVAMPDPDDLPLEVYDPRTKTTRKLGGRFQIKDWWYD